jgi:AbrB family looped-hinge helix DNA binding protein
MELPLPYGMEDGMGDGMVLRIDKSGRIVLPKPLRDRLGLRPEMMLEVKECADGLVLRPTAQRPPLREIDGLWVHQGTADAGADWAHVLADLCDERLDDILKA